MRRGVVGTWWVGVGLAVVLACQPVVNLADTGGQADAGEAGDGDGGGSGGTTSGNGGAAGRGGSAGANARGGSGAVTGGASGSGGSTGASGTSGSGGDAGGGFLCESFELRTTCAPDETCAALDCGEPWSLHGGDGCLRQTCRTNGDCEDGERCLSAPIAGSFKDCFGSVIETCEVEQGVCSCGGSADCAPRWVCVPPEEQPAEDCRIAGLDCAELEAAHAVVMSNLAENAPGAGESMRGELEDCALKIEAQIPLCDCEPEPLVFPECTEQPFEFSGNSNCQEADVREFLECGSLASAFDTNCCRRARCAGDSDCANGGVCIPLVLHSGDICRFGTIVEDCTLLSCDGTCRCSITEDCDTQPYCFAADESTELEQCNLEGLSCTSDATRLRRWLSGIHELFPPEDKTAFYDYAPEVLARFDACIERLCTNHVCDAAMAEICASYQTPP